MVGPHTTRRQKFEKAPTATLIVALWNRADITARFLSQLKPHWGEIHQLVMVDDCSTDRTPRVLEWWKVRLGDKLSVVRNPSNLGYGPAINRGVSKATGEVVIVMNNDIDLNGPFVAPTVEKLVREPRSLITVRLVSWNGGWNKFGDQLIPYAEGWYLATWKEVWDELGGFDERFAPCDYEDVDLSYRAVQAGLHLIPLNLPLKHIGGVSINQLDREGLTHRSRRRFMAKWGFELEPKS